MSPSFIYTDSLMSLFFEQEGKTLAQKNSIWISKYEIIISSRESSVDKLPHLLSLIHPDFYYNGKGQYIGENLPWRKKNDFTSGISAEDTCQIMILSGEQCPFNRLPHVRGKCEADHVWPNSLGGPSIFDNRLLLCKYHNGMKSNNTNVFHWDQEPGWLLQYLKSLYNMKR
jgi:hypothetical protein